MKCREHAQKYTDCSRSDALERGGIEGVGDEKSLGQCGLASSHIVDEKGICSAAAVLGEREGHALLSNVADSVACHEDNPDEHQEQSEAADQLLVQQHVGAHLVHHLAHDRRRDDAPQSSCATTQNVSESQQEG